jgi:hypothetical protein
VLDIAGIDERLGDSYSVLSDNRDTITIQNLFSDDLGRTAAAVGPEWKVLFHPEGEWDHGMNFEGESQEAYHLPSDPRKQNDRCGDHPDKLEERLRTQLTEDVETDAGSGEVTGQARERIRELGYIR